MNICPNCQEMIEDGAFHIRITDGKCEIRLLMPGEKISDNMTNSLTGGVVYIGNNRLRDLMTAIKKEILDQCIVHEDLKQGVSQQLRDASILLNINVSTMNFCATLIQETIQAQVTMLETAKRK